ncbi:MAG: STAS domain-containing protein [bacterium]
MTEAKKVFKDTSGTPVGEAIAKIDFAGEKKQITLILSGIIIGDNADALRDFVRDVSCFPAHTWTLHLKRLSTISMKGTKALAKLAKILRRRGHDLEIKEANSIILAVFRETRFLKYFKMNVKPKVRKISDRHILQVNPGEPIV